MIVLLPRHFSVGVGHSIVHKQVLFAVLAALGLRNSEPFFQDFFLIQARLFLRRHDSPDACVVVGLLPGSLYCFPFPLQGFLLAFAFSRHQEA